MQNFRKLADLEILPKNRGELCQSPKTGKTEKIYEILRKWKIQKFEFQRMLIGCRMQNFVKVAQLEIPPKIKGNNT